MRSPLAARVDLVTGLAGAPAWAPGPGPSRRGGHGGGGTRLALVTAILALPALAVAQPVRVLPPAEMVPVHSAVRVRDLAAPRAEAPETAVPSERTVPFRTPDPTRLRLWKEELEAEPGAAGPTAGVHADTPAAAPLPALAVADQFEGAADADNAALRGFLVFPPDSNLGVGPAHVFEMVNSVGRILNKLGQPVQTVSLAAFFGVDAGFDEFDPRVTYDAASGRWFAVYAESSDGARLSAIILAVSTTSDPTGSFCRYRLGNPATETFLHDFPMLGVGADTVAVSYNGFAFGSEAFLGAGYYVLNKADLLACASVRRTRVAPDVRHATLFPTTRVGATGPLALVENEVTGLGVLTLSGVPGVGSVAVTPASLAIRPWIPPPPARQPGSAVLLDTGDDRVLGAVAQDQSLWVTGNDACRPAGDALTRSCLRLIEIRTDTMTVRQDLSYGTAGGYYYYPAVSPDASGNLHVVFTSSSPSEFASVRVTGRLEADPLGSFQASRLVRKGTGAQIGSPGRMGDYSGAALDPSDPTSVWVVGEYIRSTAGRDWGTFGARLSFATPAIAAATATVSLNGAAFGPGQTVTIGIAAQSPGDAPPRDLFVGVVAPDGTVAFFSAPNAVGIVTPGEPLSALTPMQELPPGVSLSVPAFVQFAVPPSGLPAGTYDVFVAVLQQGALADDSLDPGDLIAAGAASFTLVP